MSTTKPFIPTAVFTLSFSHGGSANFRKESISITSHDTMAGIARKFDAVLNKKGLSLDTYSHTQNAGEPQLLAIWKNEIQLGNTQLGFEAWKQSKGDFQVKDIPFDEGY